jgi:hypothetical protein
VTSSRSSRSRPPSSNTGLLFAGQRTVTDPIQGPAAPRPGKLTYRHKLRYPSAEGVIWLYGGIDNRRFNVRPGAHSINVPIFTGFIDTPLFHPPGFAKMTIRALLP